MSLPIEIQLKKTFDIEGLKSNLETAVQHFHLTPQEGSYHDGNWKGISLRNIDGNYYNLKSITSYNFKETKVINYCPYFKEILNNLGFPIYTARLLFLSSDKKIVEHTDDCFGWESGTVRLHIPIITHENVVFKIAGQRCCWKEGELWFGDFSLPHSVHNQSKITRVHLIMDCIVDKQLLELLPEDISEKIRQHTNLNLSENSIKLTKQDIDKYRGYFKISKMLFGIPLYGKFEPTTENLSIKTFGTFTSHSLYLVEPNRFKFLNNELIFVKLEENQKEVRYLNKDTGDEKVITVMSKLLLTQVIYIGIQTVLLNSFYGGLRLLSRLKQILRRLKKH